MDVWHIKACLHHVFVPTGVLQFLSLLGGDSLHLIQHTQIEEQKSRAEAGEMAPQFEHFFLPKDQQNR